MQQSRYSRLSYQGRARNLSLQNIRDSKRRNGAIQDLPPHWAARRLWRHRTCSWPGAPLLYIVSHNWWITMDIWHTLARFRTLTPRAVCTGIRVGTTACGTIPSHGSWYYRGLIVGLASSVWNCYLEDAKTAQLGGSCRSRGHFGGGKMWDVEDVNWVGVDGENGRKGESKGVYILGS